MTLSAAQMHTMTMPGPMLKRGFWLYVWRVTAPEGEKLYVGRTGDNSSPNAAAPYTRMGQHLGFSKAQNSLRRLLMEQSIHPEECDSYELITYGPIFPEVSKSKKLDRNQLMELHTPSRNAVGALERKLANELKAAGYDVLNIVKWKHPYNEKLWHKVVDEFAVHFPKLKELNK